MLLQIDDSITVYLFVVGFFRRAINRIENRMFGWAINEMGRRYWRSNRFTTSSNKV
jgi:hypothetical protein|tara:strand:- start:94370 stop:94537 length:168 start_codon:yes stop_codon:yes gene_type:complete